MSLASAWTGAASSTTWTGAGSWTATGAGAGTASTGFSSGNKLINLIKINCYWPGKARNAGSWPGNPGKVGLQGFVEIVGKFSGYPGRI